MPVYGPTTGWLSGSVGGSSFTVLSPVWGSSSVLVRSFKRASVRASRWLRSRKSAVSVLSPSEAGASVKRASTRSTRSTPSRLSCSVMVFSVVLSPGVVFGVYPS